MDCRECESLMPEYALGELSVETAASVAAHMEQCDACNETLALYKSVVRVIAGKPYLEPSPREQAAMAEALAEIRIPVRAGNSLPEHQQRGLAGFVLASAAAFVMLVLLLAGQSMSIGHILTLMTPQNLLAASVSMLVIAVLTSFIPIVVTARRRPLNGLTFRK